jgi:hypothetical protein
LHIVENAKPVREKSLRLRRGGPKQRKSTVRDTKSADNEEKGLVWAHIFMCGAVTDKQSGELFVTRVLALEENMRNEVMDEMARMVPAAAKGQKVWDTFWSTVEKVGKFKRVMRDETARRVTDAALLTEFGLAGLLVGENANSVSVGVVLVTECKLVEKFFAERQISMPEGFRFPKDEERGFNALGVAAAKNMMLMFNKLELTIYFFMKIQTEFYFCRGVCYQSKYKQTLLSIKC